MTLVKPEAETHKPVNETEARRIVVGSEWVLGDIYYTASIRVEATDWEECGIE